MFFFQAGDGIRDLTVTGVQTCALPISLPAAKLPLRHSVPIHFALADTGAAAVIDSIRGIRVTFTVTNGQSGAAERRYTLARFMEQTNVGWETHRTVGDVTSIGTNLQSHEAARSSR